MRSFPAVMLDYAPLDHQPQHHILVKTEDSASPDLSPVSSSLPFQFRFHPPHASKSTEHSASLPQQSVYRFTEDSAQNLVPTWSDNHNLSSYSPTMSTHINHSHSRYDWDSSHLSFQYAKDYEDVDLADVPLAGRDSSTDLSGSALSSGTEKAVRRRSSKACDQCRKSKCKCERSAPSEACKSCVMLSVPCTFLGPSRKRGPPKGYIDSIEARLHQTEALLGIIIASSDNRAQSLLRDLAQDSLAKEIINRVDNSPYGVKGRKRDGASAGPKTRFSQINSSNNLDGDGGDNSDRPKLDLTSTHPSNEWQDKVGAMLLAIAAGQPSPVDAVITAPERQISEVHPASHKSNLRVDLQGHASGLQNPANDHDSPRQRQWRRVETNIDTGGDYPYSAVDMTYAQPPQAPPQQSWGTLWDAPGAFHTLL